MLPFGLQQFFKHDFSSHHVRTSQRNIYRSCLVCDTWIRELMVLDVPPQVNMKSNINRIRSGLTTEFVILEMMWYSEKYRVFWKSFYMANVLIYIL